MHLSWGVIMASEYQRIHKDLVRYEGYRGQMNITPTR
jgi:transposase